MPAASMRWVPAFAGTTGFADPDGGQGFSRSPPIVIPANAGIHCACEPRCRCHHEMGPSIRWDDGLCRPGRRARIFPLAPIVIPANAGIHCACEPRCPLPARDGSRHSLGRRALEGRDFPGRLLSSFQRMLESIACAGCGARCKHEMGPSVRWDGGRVVSSFRARHSSERWNPFRACRWAR